MDIFDTIVKDTVYYYDPIGRHYEANKNKYVVCGMLFCENKIKVGKIVQVRLEAGEWGSDIVLLRNYDGSLTRHENNSFYLIPKRYHKKLDELFKDVGEESYSQPFTLGSEYPETGFLIQSKIPEGESTPMRNVKASLYQKIDEYCKKMDDKQ